MKNSRGTSFRELLHTEIIRKAKLDEIKQKLSSEQSAALYSVWFMQSSKVGKIHSSMSAISSDKSSEIGVFSAHLHDGLPQSPSPDDSLIYKDSLPTSLHFIIDGFTCKKAK